MMKKTLFGMMSLALAAGCKQADSGANSNPAIPVDPSVEAKVEKTLKGMSLDEKVGQMVQLTITTVMDETGEKINEAALDEIIGTYKVGSILNVIHDRAHSAAYTADVVKRFQEVSMEKLGIPCIYGLDMIHGATYLTDGTFFPQEINLAASFNRQLATDMGEVLAYETKASMTPWVFSPVMDLGRDPRWSRGWESWGEDPYLSAEMAKAVVLADQGTDPNHIPLDKVAACAKHYLAYGVPASGKDRTPAYVSPLDLRERYFAPFKESILAGALSVMVNSASINGVPTHANKELLTGWLKEGLNWDGLIVTDWADVNNLFTREHTAANKVEALAQAINAGIDMVMDPYDKNCCTDLKTAVQEGLIPMSRIDDAVRRVLRLKYRLGLFENPVWDVTAFEMGRADFVAKARAAAVESEVLLKNEDGLLPLKKGTRILVTGPNGNSMRCLNGGWSYTWQGSGTDEFTEGFNTVYEALAEKFGAGNVRYVAGVSYDNDSPDWQREKDVNIPAAVAAARAADVVVACIGENSYCETPGNMDDLNLSANQQELVKALAKTGKPIVLILNEGRPRIIRDIEPLAKAVVDIFLPSNYGGDALAELLSGDANFSARMPITYPRHINALHTYDYKVSENVSTMSGAYNYDARMDVLYPFGFGLSYTTFAYEGLEASRTEFGASDVLKFRVKVTNTGGKSGKEAVLLYSSDIVASVIPDNKRLRAFTKVDLQPGESQVVELEVPAKDLAFVGPDGKWRLEKGEFRIAVGDQIVMVNCRETKVWDTQNI